MSPYGRASRPSAIVAKLCAIDTSANAWTASQVPYRPRSPLSTPAVLDGIDAEALGDAPLVPSLRGDLLERAGLLA